MGRVSPIFGRCSICSKNFFHAGSGTGIYIVHCTGRAWCSETERAWRNGLHAAVTCMRSIIVIVVFMCPKGIIQSSLYIADRRRCGRLISSCQAPCSNDQISSPQSRLSALPSASRAQSLHSRPSTNPSKSQWWPDSRRASGP